MKTSTENGQNENKSIEYIYIYTHTCPNDIRFSSFQTDLSREYAGLI